MVCVVGRLHTETIQASLDGAAIAASRVDHFEGIMRAALTGRLEAVNSFLHLGVSVNAADALGRTVLMEAVFGGHIDIVDLLVNRGADVDAQDKDGWTALMEAAAKGRIDLVRLLLAHGANPHITNKNGWTALKTTAKCNIEVARVLKTALSR